MGDVVGWFLHIISFSANFLLGAGRPATRQVVESHNLHSDDIQLRY